MNVGFEIIIQWFRSVKRKTCKLSINNPLTPEPPVTARAAWGTCARDAFPPISPTKQNFVSKLPLLLEDL